ncbi:hypothetical protein CRC_01579 [Cylindrospermopsis raciborskii CS-505]|nr:hypothetical protein CRC_01579 [Cylindrospermopsis raciborskii CS-505]
MLIKPELLDPSSDFDEDFHKITAWDFLEY